MATFDHAANVGRELGRESPIPMSPVRAIRTGRIGASATVWNPIRWELTPTTPPRIAYWTSRSPVAPAMALTLTDNDAPHAAATTNDRAMAPRHQS
ncbi:MAG: hypothetical protein ACLQLO_32355 [Mycobacterium sp.]